MVEKEGLLEIISHHTVIGLRCVCDAANGKIVRDGYAAIRRVPRNGASPKHLPTEREHTKRQDTQTEPTQGNQSHGTTAERD